MFDWHQLPAIAAAGYDNARRARFTNNVPT
jgi:hypothetical protein